VRSAATPRALERLGYDDLVDEQIDALRVLHEVLRDLRVPRQDHGAPGVVDAIAESRPHRRVIDLERGDLHNRPPRTPRPP
jgi:hypothetical protein